MKASILEIRISLAVMCAIAASMQVSCDFRRPVAVTPTVISVAITEYNGSMIVDITSVPNERDGGRVAGSPTFPSRTVAKTSVVNNTRYNIIELYGEGGGSEPLCVLTLPSVLQGGKSAKVSVESKVRVHLSSGSTLTISEVNTDEPLKRISLLPGKAEVLIEKNGERPVPK